MPSIQSKGLQLRISLSVEISIHREGVLEQIPWRYWGLPTAVQSFPLALVLPADWAKLEFRVQVLGHLDPMQEEMHITLGKVSLQFKLGIWGLSGFQGLL